MRRHSNAGSTKKPRDIFLTFSALSFLAFLLLGFLVVNAIAPVFEQYVVDEQKAETVVFSNRLANHILEPSDFQFPPSSEQKTRLGEFLAHLQVQAPIFILLLDKEGRVIVSEPEGYEGGFFASSQIVAHDFLRVKEKLQATARFISLSSKEAEALGVREVFVQAAPLTFGGSTDVAGIVYTVSRTGFIRNSIGRAERILIMRVVSGFAALYVTLSVIVFGASRTIRHQGQELASYAGGLEQKVRARTRELEEAHRREIELKNRFVSMATHQLREPTNVIAWALDSIKNEWDKLPAEARYAFNHIAVSNQRLNEQVNSFLTIALLTAGKLQIVIENVDLVALAKEIEAMGQEYAALKAPGVTFSSALPKEPVIGRADPKLLREVLTNLVTNAVKYNKKEGLVHIAIEKRGSEAVLSVADTGMGISAEEQAHMFEEFWRSDQAVHLEGTGLGLSIAKTFMDHMHGKIWFTSKKGEGTTFFVSLPLSQTP